jgi:hypothetical protein
LTFKVFEKKAFHCNFTIGGTMDGIIDFAMRHLSKLCGRFQSPRLKQGILGDQKEAPEGRSRRGKCRPFGEGNSVRFSKIEMVLNFAGVG